MQDWTQLIPEPENVNYAGTVVMAGDVYPLSNCDNINGMKVFGAQVIVGKETQPGDLGVYFPPEAALDPEFLAANNLYRKPEWGNADPDARGGFFEQHGRIRVVKFRGHKSEGIWLPISCLKNFVIGEYPPERTTFDTIGDTRICHKYISRKQKVSRVGKQQNQKRRFNIVENQFAFHIDTQNFRRNFEDINPFDYITITEKLHGTSAIVSNLLVNNEPGLVSRFLRFLGFPYESTSYRTMYASRRVIKGIGEDEKTEAEHFYSENVWKSLHDEVKNQIPKGYTLYGEIVGYTSTGEPIQEGFHYGNVSGRWKFYVYRITQTTPEGIVLDLTYNQIAEFCRKRELSYVPLLYQGTAVHFLPLKPGEEEDPEFKAWKVRFLEHLENVYMLDKMCKRNNFEVPEEGIVIRIESNVYENNVPRSCKAFKLKNYAFLEWETKQNDKGKVSIEDIEGMDPEYFEGEDLSKLAEEQYNGTGKT